MASSAEKDPNGASDRAEMFYTLEEVSQAMKVSIENLKRRLSEGAIRGVQKGGQWMIPREEMEKLGDEPGKDPDPEPFQGGVKESTALTVLSADQEEKEEKKEEPWRKRARELFSDWLSGFRNAKWNGKLDEKVKEWIGRFFHIVERLR
ncbi:MAG: helix-turn-helix domain-containing protein, partial [Planifilum fulgidum]